MGFFFEGKMLRRNLEAKPNQRGESRGETGPAKADRTHDRPELPDQNAEEQQQQQQQQQQQRQQGPKSGKAAAAQPLILCARAPTHEN